MEQNPNNLPLWGSKASGFVGEIGKHYWHDKLWCDGTAVKNGVYVKFSPKMAQKKQKMACAHDC